MAVLKYLEPETKKWIEFFVAQPGVSFIPTLSSEGVLTWENNAHLPNPDPVSLKPEGIQMYPTRANFPTMVDASESTIYVDKSSGAMYRADKTQGTYLPLSATGSSQSIVFVDTIPTVANAEVGIIYAIKKPNGNFELWAKQNGEMVMVEGAEESNVKEIYTFNSYTDFPVVGDENCLYVSESANMTYRYDKTKNVYVTVGDKAGSVEAGHESDANIGTLTATDVINAFHS